MQAWLTERGTSWTEDMLKNEPYDLVRKNKPELEYIGDHMALEQDFVIVCLPPTNPIELTWAWIKQKVAKESKQTDKCNIFY